ncbi:AraC family transcriptional regulator [Paenibacillus nasutitermitis]|uniref:AraC family transcriptional regulator n=1 Tax=Paenibacillus nasutitermitis TaxID=1652958 RepID=A0A917E541_9BACL|nr:AraC family transcriptional regulator [Paenibacillus nasutitermitis]GGE01730.1 AraC family transcriptional regulator [Paenibacillus nasutitermitis]
MPIDFGYRVDLSIPDVQFHSHSYYEIYYFLEGECHYLIGDKIMKLAPGDLILMHGMTLHRPNPVQGKPYIRSILHFDPAYVNKLLQPELASVLLKPFEELGNIRLSLTEQQQKEVERLYADMHNLYEIKGDQRDLTAYDRFVMRFLELLHMIRGWCSQPVRDYGHRSHKEHHVQSVISYLENCYMNDLTLDDIAGALHLTKPYLSNLFKEVTGTTVFRYLYNRRINQAKILFRLEPDRSVSEVCHAVGFTHLAHFSRLFKTAVGSSPETYRKTIALNRQS